MRSIVRAAASTVSRRSEIEASTDRVASARDHANVGWIKQAELESDDFVFLGRLAVSLD